MAESENLLLSPYAQMLDGKIIGYVRAAEIVNARPEAGRLILRMPNHAEVGADAMPGAFAKRMPQIGDMYVIQPDGRAAVVARHDFLMQYRLVSDHELPGAPARVVPGSSAAPALHPTSFNPEGQQAFTAAIPTGHPPLSSWANPEDAPAATLPPVTIIDPPPRTPEDAPPPPATPIDLLAERDGKLNPEVEQPALSRGFVSTGGEATLRDKSLADAATADAEEHPLLPADAPAEADPGFGHYSPPAIPSSPELAAADYPHAVPKQVPPDQTEAALPAPEPPVSNAAPLVPATPPNTQSTIQHRDPVPGEPVPEGTKQAIPHPTQPNETPPPPA